MSKLNNQNGTTVLAHDLFGKRYSIPKSELRQRTSVYGIVRRGNQFLVQCDPNYHCYGIPGGEIEPGENIHEALTREFLEETGYTIQIGELLAVKEDFFVYGENKVHGILIFYSAKITGGTPITSTNGDDSAGTDWVTLDELKTAGLAKPYLEVLEELG